MKFSWVSIWKMSAIHVQGQILNPHTQPRTFWVLKFVETKPLDWKIYLYVSNVWYVEMISHEIWQIVVVRIVPYLISSCITCSDLLMKNRMWNELLDFHSSCVMNIQNVHLPKETSNIFFFQSSCFCVSSLKNKHLLALFNLESYLSVWAIFRSR